ncbi:alpha-hydroxy acid oxidase [Rhodococcus wratislaviensis]|uniref:Putative oxidoreductase n=1 Tax=Rhodococcus wratislaviensis NBRC 100605 TaxID=1219028 RepID=X0PW35_RHOWR|nr:alpha-hydroxy acid oxidase [Rhodococcus wratislaviensis]GAF47524.1 putative oxidoreductase [Rhodococcus wratislaviensis NBRC 100605]
MTARRLPRRSELRDLIRPRPFHWDPLSRRLANVHTMSDMRVAARRRVPQSVFDYVDGAAEAEISIGRARDAYAGVEFHPRVLRDVAQVNTSVDIAGSRASLPLILAPTGFTRMMHCEGEIAVARAAASAGIPYTLSTMGTTSLERLAVEVPDARRWFQLYLWKNREASEELVARVSASDYEALMLTVDTPVAGERLRDVRNGLTIPPSLSLRTLADMSMHPSWWANLLTTAPLEFASLNSWAGTIEDLVGAMFDPSVTMADLSWLRDAWPRKLVVKGIQSVEDAEEVVGLGADAIVVSNHGGRQLDRAPSPLELLPAVVERVGDRAEVYIDTGIMSGADLVAARALGATAGLVGRAYLYGLMAGGERGVTRTLDLFRAEAKRTLQLLGVSQMADLDARHATLRT